jgi:hypothetical protein
MPPLYWEENVCTLESLQVEGSRVKEMRDLRATGKTLDLCNGERRRASNHAIDDKAPVHKHSFPKPLKLVPQRTDGICERFLRNLAATERQTVRTSECLGRFESRLRRERGIHWQLFWEGGHGPPHRPLRWCVARGSASTRLLFPRSCRMGRECHERRTRAGLAWGNVWCEAGRVFSADEAGRIATASRRRVAAPRKQAGWLGVRRRNDRPQRCARVISLS